MSNKEELRLHIVPIHRSLTRPQLIAGCDRELFVILCLFSVLLILPGGLMSGSLFNFLLGAALLSFGIPVLAWMAKIDSSMRPIFMRSLKYKDKYLTKSTATAVSHYRFDENWVSWI